jgi:uncharacterized membrane protein AbrB (regulator of aidB expression)
MKNNTFFMCKCIIYASYLFECNGILMTTAALATSFAGLATLATLAMAASTLHSASSHLIV